MGCTSSTPKTKTEAGPTTTQATTTTQDPVEKVFAKIGDTFPTPAEARAGVHGALRSIMGANQEALQHALAIVGNDNIGKNAAVVIQEQNLPVVGVFPAESALGLATLRALTRGRFRGACARIVCVLTDESKVAVVRKTLGGKAVTDSLAFAFADYNDVNSMSAAFIGCDRLFLMPAESADRVGMTRVAVQCASAAGVGHLVFQSIIMAQEEGHVFAKQAHEIEKRIAALIPPIPYTILRTAVFAEQCLIQAQQIAKDHIYVSDLGSAKFFSVAMGDAAKCAAAILSQSKLHTEHHNKYYDICAPEMFDNVTTAEGLGKVLNSSVEHKDLSAADARQLYVAAGMPEWTIEGWLSAAQYVRNRKEIVTPIPADINKFISPSEITLLTRFLQANRYRFSRQSPLIAVWPAEGEVGLTAVQKLLSRDSLHPVLVRAIVSTAQAKDTLTQLYPENTNLEIIHVADATDGSAVTDALRTVDRLLLAPREDEARPQAVDTFLTAAKAAQVVHLCLVSVHAALQTSPIGKRFAEWEKTLVSTDSMTYTILRASPSMEILFKFASDVKGEGHKVHHCYGNAYFFPVDPRDVGNAGASVLLEGPIFYPNLTLTLTGPQPANFGDMCTELGNVLGYHVEPVADLDTFQKQKDRLQGEYDESVLEDMIFHQEKIAQMNDQTPNSDLFQLIGPTTPLKQFIQAHKSRFA